MKKIAFLLMFFAMTTNAQVINFPDANFKALLLQADVTNSIAKNRSNAYFKIDSNNDGEIQFAEALEVSELNSVNRNISDLTGILSFSNLAYLSLESDPMTNLNVSNMVFLKKLFANDVPLETLNISGTALQNLTVVGANLPALDLRPMTSLVNVNCSRNMRVMTNFNISGLTNLQVLSLTLTSIQNFEALGMTELTYIDGPVPDNNMVSFSISDFSSAAIDSYPFTMGFGNNTNLTTVNISNCLGMTMVGFTGCTNLENVNIVNCPDLNSFSSNNSKFTTVNLTGTTNITLMTFYNGFLTSLDLSAMHRLEALSIVNNPIANLSIKNGSRETLVLTNLPLLGYICADAEEISYVRQTIGGAPAVNDYCTFTPGGGYNTITGTLRFDNDNNGCNTDPVLPLMKVKLTESNGISREVFTRNSGNYTFYTQAGDYTIQTDFENPAYFITTPQNALIHFPAAEGLLQTQDFCITANGNHPDIEIVMAELSAAAPGFEILYKISFKNKGNKTSNGTVTLDFESSVIDFISTSHPVFSIIPNRLIFNYTNLIPFENREITIRMRIHSPVEINPVNIGDILHFTATIDPIDADDTLADNVFIFNQKVTGAFDPNNKICLEGDNVTPEKIGKYLHYNINFENTGNANAENIVISDTIDPNKFDIKSLQVLNSSHPVYVKTEGNTIEFIYEGINLPPSHMHPIGGHGNVLFKIKTNSNLYAGDTVENTANIYFDYNAPIVTNEAKTTFRLLNNQAFERDYSIRIHPNPAKDFVKIQSKNMIKTIDLFDVQGRILQTSVENKKETSIDLSQQSNGIYFLKITSEKGSKIEKIIKE
ncbi:hypothetical protein FNO01nite_12540 [Flavobacterium noncentrifugens]|uniref:Conserved repeat domain-containing protein/Por secretion system C-terminal sorting domain-containing protein n=1 Tax=Flavobacterium noncentrifugens TaxID=1128970 RepID=A0A1G8VMW8_9FLAO|nr:T9SS type A sorting domain-containing protein [Flavobacterium noncentrifugens]GEP50582.1 hypothetical protein FNO01nite_12540 [Flavobacterium noncentrifugens]SDJ67416.1 conserved repeat domain-containing protein/Por secretion system C-terminal sorting domain-containing protein [Flavobacterium noncentrifugens]